MESFSQSTFAYYFLSLLIEGAPFILLGTMLSGFIDVYMPSGMLERALPKRKLLAVLLSGLLGIVLPVCECAVVPVIRRLVAKGLPVSCAFTYMLAAPIVNPVTILSTWSAFNEQQALYLTLSRVGIGFLVAVTVGLLLMLVPIEKVIRKLLLAKISASNQEEARSERAHDHEHLHAQTCHGAHGHTHDASANKLDRGKQLVGAMRSGMKDFVDVAVYFTIGVCLTAMFNIMQVSYYEEINSYAADPFKGTLLLMGLAFVLSVCSTSDAFLAASLGAFSYASKMAFMVLGPMLDVKLLFLYLTVMRKRFLAIFCVALFFMVGVLCIAWGEWDALFLWSQEIERNFLTQKGGL